MIEIWLLKMTNSNLFSQEVEDYFFFIWGGSLSFTERELLIENVDRSP